MECIKITHLHNKVNLVFVTPASDLQNEVPVLILHQI